jgi:uncharacterized membrane protein (TIGR02234 family)
MTGRRGLQAAVGLCLLGAGLVLLALARTWLTVRLGAAPPLPARHIDVTGDQLAGGARVLGLVGLAGVAALPASRRLGRPVVGALVAAAGVGVVAVLVRVLADPAAAVRRTPTVPPDVRVGAGLGAWPYVGIAGGLLLVAAGLLAVARGRSWLEMSARYDAPSKPEAARVKESSLWDALDRGEDPTG